MRSVTQQSNSPIIDYAILIIELFLSLLMTVFPRQQSCSTVTSGINGCETTGMAGLSSWGCHRQRDVPSESRRCGIWLINTLVAAGGAVAVDRDISIRGTDQADYSGSDYHRCYCYQLWSWLIKVEDLYINYLLTLTESVCTMYSTRQCLCVIY